MKTTLEQALNYHNPAIITRFLNIYSFSPSLVEEIFEHTKMFLWVGEKMKNETNMRLILLKDQFLLDEMWHNFILFTRDYRNYCKKFYGHVCEHDPCVDENDVICLDDIKEMMKFIETHLGTEVLEKWYVEWPEKYNKEFLYAHLKL